MLFFGFCFQWVYLSFSPLFFASLLFRAICKTSSDSHFAFLHFFSMGMVLIPVSCTMSRTSFHSSSGTLSIRSSSSNYTQGNQTWRVRTVVIKPEWDLYHYVSDIVRSRLHCLFICLSPWLLAPRDLVVQELLKGRGRRTLSFLCIPGNDSSFDFELRFTLTESSTLSRLLLYGKNYFYLLL